MDTYFSIRRYILFLFSLIVCKNFYLSNGIFDMDLIAGLILTSMILIHNVDVDQKSNTDQKKNESSNEHESDHINHHHIDSDSEPTEKPIIDYQYQRSKCIAHVAFILLMCSIQHSVLSFVYHYVIYYGLWVIASILLLLALLQIPVVSSRLNMDAITAPYTKLIFTLGNSDRAKNIFCRLQKIEHFVCKQFKVFVPRCLEFGDVVGLVHEGCTTAICR